MTLAAGTRLGPYEIHSAIGAGGMGEVYRARDERLGREVAVKVLPEAVAGDRDRLARFEREARALARLEHPNILTIHDIGEQPAAAGVTHFAVTELLTGETLGHRLARERLSWRRAVEIGAAVADGLAAAHAQGVVHRDLKPDNLFLTADGRVKILDFGLATSGVVATTSADTASVVTKPGAVLGTVGYMAPEQIDGSGVDARADLFALGCVLCEMVTGRRAFARGTPAETLCAILSAPAPEVLASGTDAPLELARIIGRCLEKQPAARFQSASDLAFALRALVTAPMVLPGTTGSAAGDAATPRPPSPAARRRAWMVAGGALALLLATAAYWAWPRAAAPPSGAASGLDPKKIVVAVFANQTGDTSLDALGIQISDWLTQSLTRMSIAVGMNPDLPSVGGPALPRPAAASGSDPVRALAERTGAGLVVTGTYYLERDTLRVQSRIVEVAGGGTVVALDPTIGPRSQSSELLTRLANTVTGAVATRLNSVQVFGSGYRPPPYDAYLEWAQGMVAWGTNNSEAERHLRAALQLDPNFILGRVNLVALLNGANRVGEADALLRPAEESAAYSRATLVEQAWVRLGRAVINGDLVGARTASGDIARLAPSPLTIYSYGMIERALHHPRAALAAFSTISVADSPAGGGPGVSYFLRDRAAVHHELGEYNQELADARLGQERYPAEGSFFAEEIAALVALGRAGEIEAVIARCEKATLRSGSMGAVLHAATRELAAHGQGDAARAMAAREAAWYTNQLGTRKPALGLRAAYASALEGAGKCRQAVQLRRDLAREAPESNILQGGYATALVACGGSRVEALAIADALAKVDRPYVRGVQLYQRARVLAALGDADGAVRALEAAHRQGWMWNSGELHLDACWNPIRSQPAFIELLKPKD